jgi:hypothetical protein
LVRTSNEKDEERTQETGVRAEDGRRAFTLWSQHKSSIAAERSYRELTREEPSKDIEIVDVRTGERKRYGSRLWRRDHNWDETFKLDEPPCSEPTVAPSGVVDYYDDARNLYGCLPCPSCGGVHRAPYVKEITGKHTVECDDCGHVEPGSFAEGTKMNSPYRLV